MLSIPPRINWLEVLGLFSCALVLFTWGIHAQEVISFDSRFYLFALEMWQQGFSWFPTTYSQLYPDYPVTSTFLIYLIAIIFGKMNKLIAHFPTAITGAMTVTITYLIGALQSKRWGFYAVFFLLLTLTFLKSARSLALDMHLAMITTCCFYMLYSTEIHHKPSREWGIYLLLFLGFALRGPIGLIIPTGVVGIYYLQGQHFKKFIRLGIFSLMLLVLCTTLLLALAYLAGGEKFMQDVMRMQVIGRIQNDFVPVYFYFTHSFKSYTLSYPLACLMILGLCRNRGQEFLDQAERRFLLKLSGWMFVILLGMSIPGDKKIRYILPTVPASALLAAGLFITNTHDPWIKFIRGFLIRFLLLFPLIFLVLFNLYLFYASKNQLYVDIHPISFMIFLFIMQMINFFVWFRIADSFVIILFIAVAVFVFSYIRIAEPIVLAMNKARDFVMLMEEKRSQGHAKLVFNKKESDGLPIKYMINMPHYETPLFIQEQQELLNFSSSGFFVMSSHYFFGLPKEISKKFQVIAVSRLGHKKVVVFVN